MSPWTALVPVKPWHLAKSRLDLPGPLRQTFARAFTLDLLDLLTATPEIARTIVVTDEDELLRSTHHAETYVLADPGVHAGDTLNAAIGAGRDWARAHHPADRLLVIPADLACLTPRDLSHALAVLEEHQQAFVPDSSATGTSLLAAITPRRLVWSYGQDSAARHRELGLEPVTAVGHAVRADIDTLANLEMAGHRGLHGTRTKEAAASLCDEYARHTLDRTIPHPGGFEHP